MPGSRTQLGTAGGRLPSLHPSESKALSLGNQTPKHEYIEWKILSDRSVNALYHKYYHIIFCFVSF